MLCTPSLSGPTLRTAGLVFGGPTKNIVAGILVEAVVGFVVELVVEIGALCDCNADA